MDRTEANDRGKDRGIEVSSYIDMPVIGQEITNFDLPNFIGMVKSMDDCKEVFMEMASESESNGRQFSPFEFIDLSSKMAAASTESPELWDAFDEGITEGIEETWEKRSQYYADNPVVVISYLENGWDISVIPSDPVKSAWADNGQSAYSKAQILSEFNRDENGQVASIVWLHSFDVNGQIMDNGRHVWIEHIPGDRYQAYSEIIRTIDKEKGEYKYRIWRRPVKYDQFGKLVETGRLESTDIYGTKFAKHIQTGIENFGDKYIECPTA
jgi:hypothetical protein